MSGFVHKIAWVVSFFFLPIIAFSYPGYWQQKVNYTLSVDFDATKHQFEGKQKLVYYNNSPDTLKEVFYYLFFNAFQPGSEMDTRSRWLADADPRVQDRISKLQPNEIGYQKIRSLTQNTLACKYEVNRTILEVELAKWILPGDSAVFEMQFSAQVPLQIRRSGRDSREGIAYSMTQWYPKMCEYDQEGWHAHPYIAREFHGVWGDYDVTIHIDSSYTVGATGYLQNPNEIGHGYSPSKGKSEKLSWHFKAPNVHDFAWTADPDYVHTTVQVPDGPLVHFFYQATDEQMINNWTQLKDYTVKLFQIMNQTFGKYPYDSYSVLQGGDGGMEYPMATLITGKRGLRSLVGVTVHEVIHSWFQMVLASNEAKYPWMDEGFTDYATGYVTNILFNENKPNPHEGSYNGYFGLAKSGVEEPSSTHSDHYSTNFAYGAAAYSKGAVCLHQLSYVIGKDAFFKGMRLYYNTWKFKHPEPRDFKRIMEKVSGMELDWYFEYWINTTHTIDYSIKEVKEESGKTQIMLERIQKMPMPIDVMVTYKDGKQALYTIPLDLMRDAKNDTYYTGINTQAKEDWPWTFTGYKLTLEESLSKINKIEIDPSHRLADIDRSNNMYTKQ